ncbi:unnamed protein product [Merluccius merluccius]
MLRTIESLIIKAVGGGEVEWVPGRAGWEKGQWPQVQAAVDHPLECPTRPPKMKEDSMHPPEAESPSPPPEKQTQLMEAEKPSSSPEPPPEGPGR